MGRQLQQYGHTHKREQAHRYVHPQRPAPAGTVGQPSAQQRSRHRGEGEDSAHDPHVASALAGGDDVGDGRLREDHQTAAAEALKHPGGDQHLHRWGCPADRRADGEGTDREYEERLAAEHIAELAVDGHHDR